VSKADPCMGTEYMGAVDSLGQGPLGQPRISNLRTSLRRFVVGNNNLKKHKCIKAQDKNL
jgi:hypothetical protein